MRIGGIILHPTSLPGDHGIGSLGKSAYRFADFLHESGQRLWQVLPLGPPGYGNSPYQCYSSMAGNPLMISLGGLVEEGWLAPSDLREVPDFPSRHVDFERVAPFKHALLQKAASNFLSHRPQPARDDFERFCSEKAAWLGPFAEFAALKRNGRGESWTSWPRDLKADTRDVDAQKFIQYVFFRQWEALRTYCRERGIQIMGDVPIFVAHDSADVWANPELFDLDPEGNPRSVAGVPPDYFSATGQLWGNPLYRWDVMERDGYRWWIERVRSLFDQVDMVRLDHFRGFEKYYSIPAGSKTAIGGQWVDGPGDRLFSALEKVLGKLPFVAEDLGLITEEVHALRDRWDFPGMRVLQFAFCNEDPDDSFKPHNYVRNCVVYTGTHDNDTTLGWFHGGLKDTTLNPEQVRAERELALRYLNTDGREIHWDFIRAALSSVANIAIYPLQDVLGLGSDCRMNIPARQEGNWRWRYEEGQLTLEVSARLGGLSRLYGRTGEVRAAQAVAATASD